MKTISCTVNLSKVGHQVRRSGITPAEALVLIAMHGSNVSRNPLEDVKDDGEVERTPAQEIRRLLSRYPNAKVKALFPTNNANLPQSFEEAVELGMGVELPKTTITGEIDEMAKE